jgi:hypothetical protein
MLVKEIPSTEQVIQQLNTYYKSVTPEQLDEGKQWYSNSRLKIIRLANTYNKTIPQVAGITARLSPSISWGRNLIAAENLLRGETRIDGYGFNVEIAERIRDGFFGTTDIEVSYSFPVNARKIFAFYHNLQHPESSKHVTVDRWMLRACYTKEEAALLHREAQLSKKVYLGISDAIKQLAKSKRLPASTVQAVIWIAVRGK